MKSWCNNRRISLFVALLFATTILIPRICSAEGPCEVRRGLVILTEFPDVRHDVTADSVRDRFRKIDSYVRAMSYGKVCVEVDVTPWYRLPRPIGAYRISASNLDVEKSRVTAIIRDALDAAGDDSDFSRYSFTVLFLGAKFREYGMVGLCGYPGMLGWQDDSILRTAQGKTVRGGVAIFTYQAHLGTLFHDIAHIWGGVKDGKRRVPCLYDHDIQREHPTRETGWEKVLVNMGFWDPLSCHFIEKNAPPPGLSSWTKIRLGWIGEEKIRTVQRGETAEVLLDPLEEDASGTLVVRVPLTASTYYLIENRQKIGPFDSVLPSSGVLIMYADDSIAESRHGKAPVRLMDANPDQPYLNGAAFSIPGNDTYIDRAEGIMIRLVEKAGSSYRIRIAPYP